LFDTAHVIPRIILISYFIIQSYKIVDLFEDVTLEEEELTRSFWGGLKDPLAQILTVNSINFINPTRGN